MVLAGVRSTGIRESTKPLSFRIVCGALAGCKVTTLASPGPLGGIEDPEAAGVAASLKRMRWAILGVGLACSAFLVAFQTGALPGLGDVQGGLGEIGILAGAAFLAAAGIGSWMLWTKLANTRARRVLLTADGLRIEFMNYPPVQLNWSDPQLRLSLTSLDTPQGSPAVVIRWGRGRMGQYANITRSGAEMVKSEATRNGFRLRSTSTGKVPNVYNETVVART